MRSVLVARQSRGVRDLPPPDALTRVAASRRPVNAPCEQNRINPHVRLAPRTHRHACAGKHARFASAGLPSCTPHGGHATAPRRCNARIFAVLWGFRAGSPGGASRAVALPTHTRLAGSVVARLRVVGESWPACSTTLLILAKCRLARALSIFIAKCYHCRHKVVILQSWRRNGTF